MKQARRSSALRWFALSTTPMIVASLLLTSSEAASADSLDEQNQSALSRIAAGTYTTKDLNLVKSQPDLASQVPDPTAAPETKVTVTDTDGKTVRNEPQAAGCYWYKVTHTKRSLTGDVIYRWYKYAEACTNGAIVTRWVARHDHTFDRQDIVVIKELVQNYEYGIGSSRATSLMQRHLEYCIVKYGCYAHAYPWAKFHINGNATWSWEGNPS